MAIPDHYAALGIDPAADQEVIAAAYRALAKKYHPDTGATTGTASAERFAAIQDAYEVLGSPASRRRYDAELLADTRRELDEHLARKRRLLEGSGEAAGAPAPPPPPEPADLGIIRPERRSAGIAGPRASLRGIGPFLVVSGLLLAVTGGLASLYLAGPASPPQPVAEADAPGPMAALPPKPRPEPGPEATPEPSPEPAPEARPAAKPGPQPEAGRPVFGTSMLDEPALPPPPAPDDAEEPAVAAAPIPKPRPPRPAAPAAEERVADVPARRYSLIIYERGRDGDTLADQGGVVFSSQERCADFGERAVLRRLAAYEGDLLRPRIWYRCEESP